MLIIKKTLVAEKGEGVEQHGPRLKMVAGIGHFYCFWVGGVGL